MSETRKQKVIVLALSLAFVAGAGCTNTDVLTTGTGSATLVFQASPASAGRYEAATLSIQQVAFRPADPTADVNLGTSSFTFMTGAISFGLTQAAETVVVTRPLTPGVYRIISVTFGPFQLTDLDPPASPASCIENFATIPTQAIQGDVPSSLLLTGFGPDDTFTVGASGVVRVRIRIDGPAFASLFESAFVCKDTSSCFSTFPTRPPPCLDAFNVPSQDALRALLTID